MQAESTSDPTGGNSFTPNPYVARFGLVAVLALVAVSFLVLIVNAARGEGTSAPAAPTATTPR